MFPFKKSRKLEGKSISPKLQRCRDWREYQEESCRPEETGNNEDVSEKPSANAGLKNS